MYCIICQKDTTYMHCPNCGRKTVMVDEDGKIEKEIKETWDKRKNLP